MITTITKWLFDLVVKIFTAVWDFFSDIVISIVDGIFQVLATVLVAIPAPDFLTQHSLSSIVNRLPSDVLYFVHALNLPEALTIIAAGFAFRMTRKIFTLGQW